MLSKNQLGFLYMFMSICAFSLMDIIRLKKAPPIHAVIQHRSRTGDSSGVIRDHNRQPKISFAHMITK